MVDLHTHILPELDDGSESVEESIKMLRLSSAQGVTDVCLTPHFSPYQDSPDDFLRARAESFAKLKRGIGGSGLSVPRLHLGAEVAFFHGISSSAEMRGLTIGQTNCLLVEMPMEKWSDYELDEVEGISSGIGCIPVLAHIDRYMRASGDASLFERVRGRRMLFQFNSAFFLQSEWREYAVPLVRDGYVHFIGSDCHGISWRPPDIGSVQSAFSQMGFEKEFFFIADRARSLLNPSGNN